MLTESQLAARVDLLLAIMALAPTLVALVGAMACGLDRRVARPERVATIVCFGIVAVGWFWCFGKIIGRW